MDDDDLELKIERAIRANCFAQPDNHDEVGGIDFAVEAIMKIVEAEREEDYRSTVIDLETRG